MPFQPPTFVSLTSLWRLGGAGGTYASPDLQFMATLSCGKRVVLGAVTPQTAFVTSCERFLLCPKATDIRARWNNLNGDAVEFPAGTKRFYLVIDVDDVGKGFLNEYRLAVLQYQASGNPSVAPGFAAPVPLP